MEKILIIDDSFIQAAQLEFPINSKQFETAFSSAYRTPPSLL